MSYTTDTYLFYGLALTDESMANNFEEEELEDIVENYGLDAVLTGNAVSGNIEYNVSILTIECSDECRTTIANEQKNISTEKLEKLHNFIKKYNLKEVPGWHVGSLYG